LAHIPTMGDVRQWNGPAVLPPRQRFKLARGTKDKEHSMSKILNAAIAVVGIDIGKNAFQCHTAAKIRRTILCRTLSNFKGAVRMLNDGQIVEARILARACWENTICLGGLHQRGSAFVEDLINDEMASRRNRGSYILQRNIDQGIQAPYDGDLRKYLDGLKETHPKARFLSPKDVAANSVLASAYVAYSQLSADAVHTSVTSLSRHLEGIKEEDTAFLRLDIEPPLKSNELLLTYEMTCNAVFGACVAVIELLGFTAPGQKLMELGNDFNKIKLSKE